MTDSKIRSSQHEVCHHKHLSSGNRGDCVLSVSIKSVRKKSLLNSESQKAMKKTTVVCKNLNRTLLRSSTSEPVFSIDYSPRSKFLKKLRTSGRIVKISSKDTNQSPLKHHGKRKTKDMGTNPPSYRLPKYKDVGTDPPDFAKEMTPKKQINTMQNLNDDILSVQSHKNKNTEMGNMPLDVSVEQGLESNELHGQCTFDCPSAAIQELKVFREINWFDCHGDANKIKNLRDHKCIHKYTLNERLLPQPVSCDAKGRSLCRRCGLTAASNCKSKHEVVLNSATNPQTVFEIPDPQETQPVLRRTFESSGKMKIVSVPTLSFVPHFPQCEARPLKIRQCEVKVKDPRKVTRHTINCKTCCKVTGTRV